MARGGEPVVTTIAVRFPREAAERPVANGNPPSLAEARLSVLTDSVIEVFSFGVQPELVGVQSLDLRLDAGYVVNGNEHEDAARAAAAVLVLLEAVFPDHRYWPSR